MKIDFHQAGQYDQKYGLIDLYPAAIFKVNIKGKPGIS
jgi:hypothetical protein